MGRTPSREILQRGKEIEETLGPSASDSIKLSIQFCLRNLLESGNEGALSAPYSTMEQISIGTINVTFLYDASIVMALKMLPPTQRTYEPLSKTWSVDLFALTDLLHHVTQLGYNANERLKKIAKVTNDIESAIFVPSNNQSSEGSDSTPVKFEESKDTTKDTSAEKLFESNQNTVIEILDSDDENDFQPTNTKILATGNNNESNKTENLEKNDKESCRVNWTK